jgi:hypothetical protein
MRDVVEGEAYEAGFRSAGGPRKIATTALLAHALKEDRHKAPLLSSAVVIRAPCRAKPGAACGTAADRETIVGHVRTRHTIVADAAS